MLMIITINIFVEESLFLENVWTNCNGAIPEIDGLQERINMITLNKFENLYFDYYYNKLLLDDE